MPKPWSTSVIGGSSHPYSMIPPRSIELSWSVRSGLVRCILRSGAYPLGVAFHHARLPSPFLREVEALLAKRVYSK